MDELPRESTPPPLPGRPPAMPAGPPTGGGGGLSETGAPPPAAAAPTRDRPPGLLTLIGGVLVVVGAFLPYLTVTVGGTTRSASGTSAGLGVVILGGFAIVKGVSALNARMMSIRFATPLLTAGLLVVLLVFRWNDIHDGIRTLQAEFPGVEASVGIGYWVDVAGTVVILVGGIIELAARRRV